MAKKPQTKKEETKPIIWHTAEEVLIKDLYIVRQQYDETLLKAVEFVTADNKSICYYPQNKLDKMGELDIFKTKQTENTKYKVSEFILNEKFLKEFAKKLKNEMQEIVLSFSESVFMGNTYYKIGKNQFNNIACKNIDTPLEFETKISKMKGDREKYELNEEFPM